MEDFFIWGQSNQPNPKNDKNSTADTEVQHLSNQVSRLALACQAMWELLRDHTELREADLNRKITEIDLRDGVLDAKMGPLVVECPTCRRNSSSRNHRCIWCGTPVGNAHIFGD